MFGIKRSYRYKPCLPALTDGSICVLRDFQLPVIKNSNNDCHSFKTMQA